ncbi:hypothetical protein Tco_1316032 [Tanacetum coccineum]
MENSVYLVEQCARKVALIRSPTGIEAGLEEHLAPMKRPDKFPIGDRGGFGAWFANRVWGWRVVAPPQTRPIAIPNGVHDKCLLDLVQNGNNPINRFEMSLPGTDLRRLYHKPIAYGQQFILMPVKHGETE